MILRALHRLIWAKKVAVESANAFIGTLDEKWVGPHALVPSSAEFNELLALGYMENDKINVSYLRPPLYCLLLTWNKRSITMMASTNSALSSLPSRWALRPS